MAAKQKMQVYGISIFYADPSQPGYIEQFNRNGLPTVGATNDIRIGIDAHYELIKSGRFKIFRNTSPHSLDEYSNYHYPEIGDLKPDQDSKEDLPVGQDDHTLDATRYLTMMTLNNGEKRTPIVLEDKIPTMERDHEKRLKLLKKNRGNYPGSETW
jgi:hypothetical protein